MRVLKSLSVALLVILVICAIGAVVLIHKGFRANEAPSPTEAAVARSVRNLSIPRDESNVRNPFETDSNAIQQGRDYFLNRCAVCHGVDGSAKTQVGVNLYPKAPDLRAPATQGLTDGEIHYIIENGVRFTGMPALSNAHQQASNDSWKLVLFVRSLGRITKGDEFQTKVASAQNPQYFDGSMSEIDSMTTPAPTPE